jgi:hypothetical protein
VTGTRARPRPYCVKQPGWVVHVVAVSCEQTVGVPAQLVVDVDQEHPYSAEHAVDVAFEPQGLTVPEQPEVLQEQPDCVAHPVDVGKELQGVTVPLHVPVQLQLYWDVQSDDVVIDAQAVSVPVQGVVHEQPPLAQSEDEA